MNGFRLLFLALVFHASQEAASAQTFQMAMGTQYTDDGKRVIPTDDGGAIICGSSFFIPGRSYDALISRVDAHGNLLWTRTHGSDRYEEIYDAAPMDDGGLVLVGSIYHNNPSDYNMFLMRLDSAGNLLWARQYGDTIFEVAYAVTQTNDGNIVLAGFASSDSAGFADFYLLKTDPAGNVLWNQRYDVGGSEVVYGLTEATDGSLYFAGSGPGITLLHTDADGDLLWMNAYGAFGDDYCTNLTNTPDGGVVLCGNAHQPNSLFFIDACLLRIGSDGSVIWGHRYGGSLQDDVSAVSPFPGGGYVAAGYSNSFGATNADYFVFRVDEDGNYIWASTYGGIWDHRARDVAAAADGSIFVNGYVKDSNQAHKDIYLIKMDSSGHSGCMQFPIAAAQNNYQVTTTALIPTNSVSGVSQILVTEDSTVSFVRYFCTSSVAEIKTPKPLHIFPNPSGGQLQAADMDVHGEALLEVFNAQGQCVMHKQLWVNGGFSLSVENVPAGIYWIRLQIEEKTWSGKWVKE